MKKRLKGLSPSGWVTGAGTAAFCSGGDQSARQTGGYVGGDSIPRLNVLDLQVSCMNRWLSASLLPIR